MSDEFDFEERWVTLDDDPVAVEAPAKKERVVRSTRGVPPPSKKDIAVVMNAVNRVNSCIQRKSQHLSEEKTKEKEEKPVKAPVSRAKRTKSVAVQNLVQPGDDPDEVIKSCTPLVEDILRLKIENGERPSVETSFSASDEVAIRQNAMLNTIKVERSFPPTSEAVSNFSHVIDPRMCGKNGPGVVQTLDMPIYTTFDKFLQQVLEQEEMNIKELNAAGGDPKTVQKLGFMSRNTAPSSSSSSSSSSVTSSSAPRGRKAGPVVPQQTVPNASTREVGNAPLQLFMNYVCTTLGTYEKSLPPMAVQQAARYTPTPVKINASHVADVMHEAYSPFKPCVMDGFCVCLHDFGFQMMEYVHKAEFDEMKRSGTRSQAIPHGFCYLCLLFFASLDYFHAVNGSTTVARIWCPFFHVVETPGEYKKSVILQPVSSSYSETDLSLTVGDMNYTSTEGTFGNVLPIRRYVTTDYDKFVDHVNGMSVHALREKPEVFFSEIEPVFGALPTVRPFHYPESSVQGTSAIKALSSLFSREHVDYTSGRRRMMTSPMNKNNVIRNSEETEFNAAGASVINTVTNFPLPRWWCMAGREDVVKCALPPDQVTVKELFPWDAIFTEDIRDTVKALPALLVNGRISLVEVLKGKLDLCETVDLTVDTSNYAAHLNHPNIRCRLLYVAHCVRLVVLRTTKSVYPSSGSSKKDPKVHKRLSIFYNWVTATYNAHLTKDTFDKDVSDELLDELSRKPIPYHFYDTDIHYQKMTVVQKVRETPRELLARYYPEHASLVFVPFGEALAKIDTRIFAMGTAEDILDMRLMNKHFEIDMLAEIELNSDEASLLTLTRSASHTIYLTTLYRVNVAIELHTVSLNNAQSPDRFSVPSFSSSSSKKNEKKNETSTPASSSSRFGHNNNDAADIAPTPWRRIRYFLRLFVFTHLNLLQRMYDLGEFSNAAMRERVACRGRNYVLTHYDETYPYDSVMTHEGLLVDFAGVIHCIPFPSPSSASLTPSGAAAQKAQASTGFDVFDMLGAFYPRFQAPRPPIKRHIALCKAHTAYMMLARKAIEVMLLGAYEHADHMPSLGQCIGIHRKFGSGFTVDGFVAWNQQYGSLAMLAMREFLVSTVLRVPAYNSYLTYNYPYWVDFVNKVKGAADVMRMFYGQGHMLYTVQHAVVTIFRHKLSNTTLPEEMREFIDQRQLFGPLSFQHVRNVTRVDELRVLCQYFAEINKMRLKSGMTRPGLTNMMSHIVYRRVQTIEPGAVIDLNWLVEFNLGLKEPDPDVVITQGTLKLLTAAFSCIGLGEAWGDKVRNLLLAIPLVDYEVVETFFAHLNMRYSVKSFDLDEYTTLKQVDAVCNRYELTMDMMPKISDSVISLTIAPCCGGIRSYIIQHEMKFPSYGSGHCGVDTRSGKIVDCFGTGVMEAKQLYRVSTLQESSANNLLTMQNEEKLLTLCDRIAGTSTEIGSGKRSSKVRCGTVPVMTIPLLGKVVEVTSTRTSKTGNMETTTTAYTLCSVCGSASEFSVRMFGINGFDCLCCNVKQTSLYFTPKCVFCSASVNLSIPDKYFKKTVIDDRPERGTFTFKTFYVCPHCFTRKTTGYPTKGHLIHTATEMMCWKVFKANGMKRLALIRKGGDYLDFLSTIPNKPRASKKPPVTPGKVPRFE